MTNFLQSGAALETSDEIIAAIWDVARGHETRAARIWEEPCNDELIAVWEIVTDHGRRDSRLYVWGASGRRWAEWIETAFDEESEENADRQFAD